MTETTELADELFDLVMTADPLNATLYGIAGYDHLLADLTEVGEAALRVTAVEIAARARAPADEHPVTRAVIVQQAESGVDVLDTRSAEYTITGSFFAPGSALLTILPMITVKTPDQQRDYLLRLAAGPAFPPRAGGHRPPAGLVAGRPRAAPGVRAATAFVARSPPPPPDADPLARH